MKAPSITSPKKQIPSSPEKAASLLVELKKWQTKTKALIPTKKNPHFNPKAQNNAKKGKKGKGKKQNK